MDELCVVNQSLAKRGQARANRCAHVQVAVGLVTQARLELVTQARLKLVTQARLRLPVSHECLQIILYKVNVK